MKFAIPNLYEVKHHLREPLYKNSFFLMLNSGMGVILGFVFWVVATRFYSPAHIGLASAIFAAMGLLAAFSGFGFGFGLVRFLLGEEDKSGIINSCLTIAGISSLILAVIFIFGLPLWSPELIFLRESQALLLLFPLFTVGTSLLWMHRQSFVAFRRTEFSFVQQMVWMVIKVALLIPLVAFGLSGIFVSWGIALWVAIIVGSLLIRRLQPGYRPVPIIRKGVVNEMLRFSLANYGGQAIGMLPNYLLPLMVLNVLGAEPNAYFYIAFSIASILFFVPAAVSMSLFAEGSYAPEKLRTNTLRALRLTFVILIPALAIIFLFGDKLLWLFGKEYSQNALQLLWILSIMSLPSAIVQIYLTVKRVQLHLKAIIYICLSTAVLIIGASYILMTRMGLTGVGLGFLAGQSIVAIVIMSSYLKEGKIGKLLRIE